jgi:histone-lysine N-methyltransferase ASH1L
MFYRNELFWTPLFDTLPLDSVVGRCLILEPTIWMMGRPKTPRYLEDDVYVCEYQIDRNQRSFEKILPKNRYYINTEPYVFNYYSEKQCIKRDFTVGKGMGWRSSYS